jgi:hypothetical protein
VGGAPGIRVGVSDEKSAVVLDASLKELITILRRDYGCVPMDVVV